jgi:hypothetical protein
VSVSVSKYGYDISGGPKTVGVFYYVTPVTFSSLSADGSSDTALTTKLILTFSQEITGLAAANIGFNPGSTEALKGELTYTGGGSYELAVSNITQPGLVYLTVTKTGYAIDNGVNRDVAVNFFDPSATPVSFTSLTANGDANTVTTALTLTFSQAIAGLTADNISLDSGETGAVKGALSGSNPYTLTVSGITKPGTVSVTPVKAGYNISGWPKSVAVHVIEAAFNNLTADGSSIADTTKLTLTFTKTISGLSPGDISLSGISVTKGSITDKSGGVYELAVSGIAASGNVTASVSRPGYTIAPASKTVPVTKATHGGASEGSITVNFWVNESDGAIMATSPSGSITLSNSSGGLQSFTATVSGSYSNVLWFVDGWPVSGNPGTGQSIAIKRNDYPAGSHTLGVQVYKDSVPYSTEISFTQQ